METHPNSSNMLLGLATLLSCSFNLRDVIPLKNLLKPFN